MKLNKVDRLILKYLADEQLATEANVQLHVEFNTVEQYQPPYVNERLCRLMSAGYAQVINAEMHEIYGQQLRQLEEKMADKGKLEDEEAARYVIAQSRYVGLYGITEQGLLKVWRMRPDG